MCIVVLGSYLVDLVYDIGKFSSSIKFLCEVLVSYTLYLTWSLFLGCRISFMFEIETQMHVKFCSSLRKEPQRNKYPQFVMLKSASLISTAA